MGKVKTFVKEHKMQIIGGAVVIVTVAGIVLLLKHTKAGKAIKAIKDSFSVKDLPKPVDTLCTVEECWKEGDVVNAIVNDYAAKDLGKLGELFVGQNGITEDTLTSIVISFINE